MDYFSFDDILDQQEGVSAIDFNFLYSLFFVFSDLNDKQKEAVFHGDGPMLIVAGAGSGKTKALTSRLAFLIAQKKIKPERILAITFTNKAADEMGSRVKKIIAQNNIEIEKEPFLGTFHSFGAWILRREAKRFGRNNNFSIFDDDDSLRLIKKMLKNRNDLKEKIKSPATLVRLFSRIKSELENKEDYSETPDEIIWDLFDDYESALKNNNAFDFDDLIEKPVRLFKQELEILEKYQKLFDYILVDEYQDINTAQYWLIRLLAMSHKNINVVGDDQQSIYGFRFSDFRNFLNFERDWQSTKTVFLEQNYRSTKKIIESASQVIANNQNQKTKNLWTDNKEGEPIEIYEHQDEFDEADFVVSKVRELVAQKQKIGILFRTNAQSRPLEQMFLEYGIEYNLYGALSFYERKEIKDVIAALRIIYNKKDEVSLERLSKNFSKKDFVNIREKLLAFEGSNPSDGIELFLKTSNYFELLKKDYPNYQERYENIYELIYFSKQFDNLGNFLEKISLASPLDQNYKKRKRDGQINLMTIHLAKGLEFDCVILVGVNEGILPHQRSLFSADDLEEERRLMYVAMTRAKNNLIISFYKIPSRFLSEIPGNNTNYKVEKELDDDERYIEY